MKHIKRVLPISATLAGVVVAAAAIPTESPRSGARRFVKGLSPEKRVKLTQAEILNNLPPEYRRALAESFAEPEERAFFWRRVVSTYRQSHSLSPLESQVLDRVEGLLTPDFFRRDPETRSSEIATARAEVERLLGEDAARELFSGPGRGVGSGSVLPWSERLRFTWRGIRPASLVAAVGLVAPTVLAYECNCVDEGDCYGHTTCQSLSCDVETGGWPGFGCGSWNDEDCTKLCAHGLPQG